MINEMDDLGSQRPSSGVSAIVLLGLRRPERFYNLCAAPIPHGVRSMLFKKFLVLSSLLLLSGFCLAQSDDVAFSVGGIFSPDLLGSWHASPKLE